MQHFIGLMQCMIGLLCLGSKTCQQPAQDTAPASAIVSNQTKIVLNYKPFAETEIPVLRVWLNDKVEANFVVDTGSNNCIISDTVVTRLGLTPHPLFGKDGKPVTDMGRQAQAVSLKIRLGHFVPTGQFVVLDHGRLALHPGDTTDGVIGLNMLSMVDTLFDFQRHQITLFYPGNLSAEDRANIDMRDVCVLSNISTTDFVFSVPVLFNGTVGANITLDTGSAVTHVDASVLKPLRLAPSRRGVTFRTIQGESQEDDVEVQTFRLGSLLLNKQELFSWNNAPSGLGGLLGMDVLAHYRLLLDHGAKKAYLKLASHMEKTEQAEITVSDTAQNTPRIAATMPLEALPGSLFPCVRMILDDGKPYLFVLDLSAAFSPLDRSIAEQTKLPVRADKDETGKPVQALRTFVHPVTLNSVVPAGAGFPNLQVPFNVSDLTNFRSAYPQSAGGMGVNLLQASAWHLDFGRQQLTMLFPGGLAGTPEEPQGAARVPLQKKNGVLYVSGTVDGKPAEFVLDSEKTVLQSGETLTALQPIARLQQTQQADGKPDAQATVRLHELKIGDVLWKQPVVMTLAREDKRAPNLIGLDLLRRYRITLDPASQSLYLEPDPAYKEMDDSVVGLGFRPRVNADKNLEVVSLSLPSPASEAGLKVGDVITAVNGLPVQTTPVQKIAEQVQHKPEGTVITLVILAKGQDKPREITLKVRKLL